MVFGTVLLGKSLKLPVNSAESTFDQVAVVPKTDPVCGKLNQQLYCPRVGVRVKFTVHESY